MTYLIKAIKKIARLNPEGFTVELTTFKKVTKGYTVAYLETQNCFDNEGLKKVLLHAASHDNVVGGWFNEENGKYYFDSIKVFDNEAEAIEFGKQNEQIAIFDLENLKVIKL